MENSINNKEVKKNRFNVVDAIILLAIIALIFAVLYSFDPFGWFAPEGRENVKLVYTVEFKGVDNDVKDNIVVGEKAFLSSTPYVMGEVIEVKTQESFIWEYDEEKGVMTKKTLADKTDLYVTIEVKCTYEKGSGFVINGQQIVYGAEFDLRFGNFFGNAYCVGFDKAK